MRKALPILLAWCAGPALFGESAREWIFPAMVYGAKQWSVVKITGKSAVPAELSIEAYTDRGERMDVPGTVTAEPGKTVELRIQGAASDGGFGWVRVRGDKEATKQVRVEAVTEYLVGNEIRWIAREKAELTTERSRMAAPMANSFLYLLNAGDKPLHVQVCWTDRATDRSCQFSKGKPSRATIPPMQTLFASVGPQRGRYLVTVLNESLPAALMFFDQAKGAVKTFSTESTLTFEADEDTVAK